MSKSDMISNYGGDCKFEYIIDKRQKLMLQNAFQAISEINLWDFVGKDIDSFTWSESEQVKSIAKKMSELGYDDHSGFSFGWTMRAMQYLVKYGEEKFKIDYYGK
jgi:hypothetical protein